MSIAAAPRPASAAPLDLSIGGSDVGMGIPMWKERFADLLIKILIESGGDPAGWPQSTIDTAPMALLQDVYEQMGGDPALLNLNAVAPCFRDLILMQSYLAVGGDPALPTLIDASFEIREAGLWAFFEDLGGAAAVGEG